MDPSVASNTLISSTGHWAQFFFWSASRRVHPTSHRPEHHAMGQSLIARPLYGSRQEAASFADRRLNALASCLLDSLGIRHAVVGALVGAESLHDYVVYM